MSTATATTTYDPNLGITIRATHHDCRLFYGERCFANLPEAIGRKDEQSPRLLARNHMFNEDIGRVWIRRMQAGGTRYNDYLEAAIAAERIRLAKNLQPA